MKFNLKIKSSNKLQLKSTSNRIKLKTIQSKLQLKSKSLELSEKEKKAILMISNASFKSIHICDYTKSDLKPENINHRLTESIKNGYISMIENKDFRYKNLTIKKNCVIIKTHKSMCNDECYYTIFLCERENYGNDEIIKDEKIKTKRRKGIISSKARPQIKGKTKRRKRKKRNIND